MSTHVFHITPVTSHKASMLTSPQGNHKVYNLFPLPAIWQRGTNVHAEQLCHTSYPNTLTQLNGTAAAIQALWLITFISSYLQAWNTVEDSPRRGEIYLLRNVSSPGGRAQRKIPE